MLAQEGRGTDLEQVCLLSVSIAALLLQQGQVLVKVCRQVEVVCIDAVFFIVVIIVGVYGSMIWHIGHLDAPKSVRVSCPNLEPLTSVVVRIASKCVHSQRLHDVSNENLDMVIAALPWTFVHNFNLIGDNLAVDFAHLVEHILVSLYQIDPDYRINAKNEIALTRHHKVLDVVHGTVQRHLLFAAQLHVKVVCVECAFLWTIRFILARFFTRHYRCTNVNL